MPSYYSHGKLLISCEYAVLDGAKALALPTKLGQRLDVSKKYTKNIHWKSLDYQNKLWFETTLSIPNFEPSLVNPITRRLSQCFAWAGNVPTNACEETTYGETCSNKAQNMIVNTIKIVNANNCSLAFLSTWVIE